MGEYWELSDGVSVHYIENQTDLEEKWSLYVSTSRIVALDCEWPPEQTGRRPKATLLQLCCMSSSTSDSFNSTPPTPTTLHVLLLDLLSLPPHRLTPLIQSLLRDPTIIKLGYALIFDLRALHYRFSNTSNDSKQPHPPSSSSSIVTPVKSALDIALLHRKLLTLSAPGIKRPPKGLSGLLESQLGSPLDKRFQCSPWGARPLSEQQLHYAANDVVCLIYLLKDVLQCVDYKVKKWSIHHHHDGKKMVNKEEEEEETSLHVSPSSSLHTIAVLSDAVINNIITYWASCSMDPLAPGDGGIGAATNGTVGGSNKQDADQIEMEVMILNCPFYIPWLKEEEKREEKGENREEKKEQNHDHDQQQSTTCIKAAPKFICDVMLNGLSRQLRLVGINSSSIPPVDKHQRYMVYRQLTEQAEDQGRVVLTRDKMYMGKRYTDQAYWVRGNTKHEQLKEILQRFFYNNGDGNNKDREISRDRLLSRCAKCNGEFINQDKAMTAEEVREMGGGVEKVNEGVLSTINEFWVCEDCGAVYWQGAMYDRALERLLDELKL